MFRGGASARKTVVPGVFAALLCTLLTGGATVPSPRAALHAPADRPPEVTFDAVRRFIDDGRYAEAEAAARQLITRAESEIGPESLDTARAIDLLVELFWRTVGGRRPEALQFGQRALAIKEKLLGRDDEDIAISLVNLGGILRQTSDYAGAAAAFERSLAIRERLFGQASLPVALTLSGQALAVQDSGRLAEARRLLERALPILEASLPSDHPDLAMGYSNLGVVLRNSGEYPAAIAAHTRALAIREKALVEGHPDTALTLGNLGGLCYLTGDFTGARAMYERTLPMREQAYGPVNPRVAEIINNMADLARDTGKYEEARGLYGRALEIWNATLGPQHPYTALSSEGLALLLRAMGDVAGAEPLFRQAIQIWEKAAGPRHPLVAINMRNLADVLRERGDFAGARAYYERSLAILEGAPAPNQPEISTCLTGLAGLLADCGEFAAARPLYERALQINRKSLGARHPRIAEDLTGLARISFATGAAGPALKKSLEAETILRDHLKVTARSLSEREALLYEQVRGGGLDIALSAIAGGSAMPLPSGAAASVWDEVVRSRATVLDEMAARHSTGFQVEAPGLAASVGELDAARAAYARLAVRGRPEEHPGKYRDSLEQARLRMEAAERGLASRSARFRQHIARSRMGIAQAASGLPSGGALVAFVAYRRQGRTSPDGEKQRMPRPEPSYLALVTVQGKPGVRAFPLGTTASIDDLIGKWRREAGTPATDLAALARYRAAGSALRAAIWDPFARELSDSKLVLVVPDGAIHNVSLATLPTGAGQYLIESGPQVHYLSAERDLIRPPGGPPGVGLLVLGGPDYDSRPGSGQSAGPSMAAARATVMGGPLRGPAGAPAGSAAPCADVKSTLFRQLPGAKYEADEVESLWLSKGRAVVKLTGRGAAEEAFKRLAAGHEVLHLATHGFFLRGDCAPLQLSGLALAGANLRVTGEAGDMPEDGILTAEEIASLDLRGVRWAVLSACETGLGPVQAGEGVLGLRRAFEVAGAGTLILSLWEVGDHDARDWIRGLYEGKLKGLSTAQAIHDAGARMLEARRQQGAAATHPFAWGAFVAAGDWR